MRVGGGSVSDWIMNDVCQEEDAVALYEQHIKAIGNPQISDLLRRILSDEKSHLGDLERAARTGLALSSQGKCSS